MTRSSVSNQLSLADSLITYKEEYNKYHLQNLSRDYGIGFLEDGDEVIIIKIDDDMGKPVMIEEDESLISKRAKAIENGDDFGFLIEIDEEWAYLLK